MNREQLEKPFAPAQIKRRQGANGDVLDYIEGSAVIQRLNDCFDGEWIFEIQEHRVYDDEVVGLGKLTAQGISKSQFGKSRATRRETDRSIVSLGDDLKAAATDCLKKCATLFGVGLHLYVDGPQLWNGNGLHRSEAERGSGAAPGRLTAKQLAAIFSLAKANGWSSTRVQDFSHEMFGKRPGFLDKREASAVIQHLQGSRG